MIGLGRRQHRANRVGNLRWLGKRQNEAGRCGGRQRERMLVQVYFTGRELEVSGRARD